MKQIPLTRGLFALVDDEDEHLLSRHSWYACKKEVDNTYYAATTLDGRCVRMHRLLLNAPAGVPVDHKDRNGLNNQKSNLRLAPAGGNQHNQGKNKRNSTGFKGVSERKGRYQASIGFQGRLRYLGRYDTPEEAHEAYKKAAIELHGEFARWE